MPVLPRYGLALSKESKHTAMIKAVVNTVLAIKQRDLQPALAAEAIRSGEVCPEMMLPQPRGDCNNDQQLNRLLVEK